jgi:hypothetical protein
LETSRDFSAKNQGHIHNYVYKLEGLLAKESGRIGSEESNRSGGFLQNLQDTETDPRVMKFFRGFFARPSSSSLDSTQNRGMGVLPVALSFGAAGAPGTGGSGECGKRIGDWGNSRACSPWREKDGRRAGGRQPWQPAAEQGGGGVSA